MIVNKKLKAGLIAAGIIASIILWVFLALAIVYWVGTAILIDSWGWSDPNAQCFTIFMYLFLLIGVPVGGYNIYQEVEGRL